VISSLSQLCTSLLVYYTATSSAFDVPNCPTNQRWPQAHQVAISEIFSLHRSSPLATQQEINNMSAATLNLEQWRASEVVLLDIGKSLCLHCSSPLCHHCLLRRDRLQQASTNLAIHACNLPTGVVWSGLASNHPKHSRQRRRPLVRAVLLRFPGRLLPQVLTTPLRL
jgi:hypothetical protein